MVVQLWLRCKMEIRQLIKQIVMPLFKEELQELSDLEFNYKQFKIVSAENIIKYKEEMNKLNRQIAELNIQKVRISTIDAYCQANFKKIPNIAYKGKREINTTPYSVYLNEMIQPDAFEVIKFKKGIEMTDNMLSNAVKIGNKVAQWMTWDSDNNLSKSGDYYLTPSEALCRRKADCEDHANIVASISPELGVAYGYAEGIGWHCFNVFVHQENLHVLDTVEDSAFTLLYDNSGYKINYIVTKDNTYQVDGSVSFGIIAGGQFARRYKSV